MDNSHVECYRGEVQNDVPLCHIGDLNKRLNDDMKRKFKGLFYDSEGHPLEQAWRMFYGHNTPDRFLLDEFGIDIDNPTVRDAVAFDLMKLDEGCVSNDWDCEWEKHIGYSPREYGRMLLHKNFRINLVHTEPQYSMMKYDGQEEAVKIETVDFQYQGLKFSDLMLSAFKKIHDWMNNQNSGFFLPITSYSDITMEVALITKVHPSIRQATSRAYYDRKYWEYKKNLRDKYGIRNIASFALVDESKDKNHTGEFLIKVQFNTDENGKYQYIVMKVDINGQFSINSDGQPFILSYIGGAEHLISVCESDFIEHDYDKDSDEYVPDYGKVTMVKSTTSSHYSVFAQRIPDYDLKYVRNYLQFKNRLEGMELCLEYLNRDMKSKEVQCSSCFSELTLANWELIKWFSDNRPKTDLLVKFYGCLSNYDRTYVQISQIREMIDSKKFLLNELTLEYNGLDSTELDRKIELGRKIRSLKLEIDVNLTNMIDELKKKLVELKEEMERIKKELKRLKELDKDQFKEVTKEQIQEFQWGFTEKMKDTSDLDKRIQEIKDEAEKFIRDNIGPIDSDESMLLVNGDVDAFSLDIVDESEGRSSRLAEDLDEDAVDFETLKKLIDNTYRWRNFMYNLAYELEQMREMHVICEDNTIMVRRLVNNFKERMEKVEKDVWNERHMMRKDALKNITSSSIQDVILLNDWYACNAPGKSYSEMGFPSEEEFQKFREKCNKVSLSLRKNQYAQLLAGKIDRIQDTVLDIQTKLEEMDVLEYEDIYGVEGSGKKDESHKWSLNDITRKQVDFIRNLISDDSSQEPRGTSIFNFKGCKNPSGIEAYHQADMELQREEEIESTYRKDQEMLKERTLEYMKKVGLIETESDLEKMVVLNKSSRYSGNLDDELKKIEVAKETLDYTKGKMVEFRKSLQKVLDELEGAEKRIKELQDENMRIVNKCAFEKNNQIRRRLLLDKIENQNTIVELSGAIKSIKDRNFSDLGALRKMRSNVDKRQGEYDKVVSEFKQRIGIDEETLGNMMVAIYNRWKDEILGGK